MEIDNLEKTIKRSRLFVAVLFAATVGLYMGWFFFFQEQTLSTDSGSWGTFGDFVGGVLNPLIAYSAFYWLTVSVLVQKQELTETRKALKEASEAQRDQAEFALKSAKIQAINMRFQKLNIALEAELAYRNSIIENGLSGNLYKNVLNKLGEQVKPKGQIENCNSFIARLEDDQHLLIRQVEELISET